MGVYFEGGVAFSRAAVNEPGRVLDDVELLDVLPTAPEPVLTPETVTSMTAMVAVAGTTWS